MINRGDKLDDIINSYSSSKIVNKVVSKFILLVNLVKLNRILILIKKNECSCITW